MLAATLALMPEPIPSAHTRVVAVAVRSKAYTSPHGSPGFFDC